MSATAEAYILFLFFVVVMFLLYGFFQKRLKIQEDMLNNHNLSGLSVLIQNRLGRRYNVEFVFCKTRGILSERTWDIIIWGAMVFSLVVTLCVYLSHLKRKTKKFTRTSQVIQRTSRFPAQADQNNVYNISSRVQGPNPPQYPDAYLSVEHITITNELNKPPKYDDAPPSYEDAIKLATAHSNSIQTFQAEEQARSSPQTQSSSSTLPTAVIVVPRVSNQTTE